MLEAFYDEVFASPGFRVIAEIDGKQHPKHYATDRPLELLTELSKTDKNIFISLGAYADGPLIEHVTSKNEVVQLKGQCEAVSSWVFDLDVDPDLTLDNGKKYGSIQDAIKALDKAVSSQKVPVPRWVVLSGGGLHFYYVLGHAVDEKVWTSICEGLRAACQEAGLRIDRTVGTFPYRLIRAPGTLNHKFDPPRRVKILGKKGPISTLKTLKEHCVEVKPKTYVTANTPNNFEPLDAEYMFKACPRMEYMRQTQGKHEDNDAWIATANLCSFLVDGNKLFHELSKGHDTYQYAESQDTFERVSSQLADAPYRCDRLYSSKCKGCEHFGEHRSPIQAGRLLKKPPAPILPAFQKILDADPPKIGDVVTVPMPEGFSKQGNQLFFHDEVVSTYFEVGRAQFNPTTNVCVAELTRHTGDKCVFPLKALGRSSTTSAELANLGFRVLNDEAVLIYIKDCSMMYPPVQEHTALGWAEGSLNFITPAGLLPGNAPLVPSFGLRRLTDDWEGSEGDANLWVKAISMLGLPGQEPMLMCVLASLASPLLQYLGLEKGVIYSMAGDKGMGKSTAMRIANSVWGQPISSTVRSNDTYNSMRKKIGLSGNLPMTIDETTLVTPEELQKFAYEIGQGAGRSRLTSSGHFAEEEQWQLIAISNSNNSMHRKLTENPVGDGADMTRVFEVDIKKSEIYQDSNVSADEGQIMSNKIKENFGLFGPLFIEELFKQDKAELRKEANKLRSDLKLRFALDGTARFYETFVVACHIAHRLAKHVSNDFPGNVGELYEWMQRKLVVNMETVGTLLDIRMPSVDNFLIEYEQDSNIRYPDESTGEYSMWGAAFKGVLYAKGDKVIVPVELFRQWCKKHSVSSSDMIKRWAEGGHLVPVKRAHDKDPQYTGTCPYNLNINGKPMRPNVLIIERLTNVEVTEELQERAETSPTGNATSA